MDWIRRRSGLLSTVLVGATVWLVVSAVSRAEADVHSHTMAVQGHLRIFNSADAGAIFDSGLLHPGSLVSGTVTVGNTGTGTGPLFLSTTRLIDTPGQGGGRLSRRLILVVSDISHPGNAQPVYRGLLARMRNVRLAKFRPGARRRYRFTVGFPDGGSDGADNAFEGGRLSATFLWTVQTL